MWGDFSRTPLHEGIIGGEVGQVVVDFLVVVDGRDGNASSIEIEVQPCFVRIPSQRDMPEVPRPEQRSWVEHDMPDDGGVEGVFTLLVQMANRKNRKTTMKRVMASQGFMFAAFS